MLVTAHQPNFLPGVSVIDKIRAADAVVWLDEVQYTNGGWTNRNRMPDGSWLTVPVEHRTGWGPFCTGDGGCQTCLDLAVHRCYAGPNLVPMNTVRISEHGGWRTDAATTLIQHYGKAARPYATEILRPYRLLVGLNLALLRLLLTDGPPWHFQSHLDGGRAAMAVSEDRYELRPISVRLAMMVAELGGDEYLSGSSGHRYLDERPFAELGITVRYWEHEGPNPCALAAQTHTGRAGTDGTRRRG